MSDQEKPKRERRKKNAAVDVAKQQTAEVVREVTLATGYKARLKPVAASLIDEVVGRIKDPPVPVWHNEKKGRDEPNPDDPEYLAALNDLNRERGTAAIDALVMFGVELVDGVPDDGWDAKLQYLEKRGLIDLKEFDLSDELDRDFVFKRFIAMSAYDLTLLSSISGVREEDIAEAMETFRR